MIKKTAVVVLCVAMLLFSVSCTGDPQSSVPSIGPSEPSGETTQESLDTENKLLITAVAGEVGIPYFITMEWGAKAAAKDLGVELYWTGPPDWDVASQMNFIDGCLAMNPDGMLLVPSDNESLVAYVENWMADGIGVVCADYALAKHVDIVGLESNSYNGGVEAAKYMFEANGPGGTYLPLGSSIGSYSTAQRCGGFIDTMKELDPTATILDTVYAEYEATKAAELASGAIMGNPSLSGIFCASSAVATGAASAVMEAGLRGKVKLAAFDADPQQIEDLEAGAYDVVIAQDPYQMGYDAVKILVDYALGKVTEDDFPDAIIEYPTKALTIENYNDPDLAQYKYIEDLKLVGY